MVPESRKFAVEEVPIIDLAKVWSGDPDQHREVVAEIRAAARNTGFMYLKNHGVPQAEIDAVFKVSEAFHDLPDAVKEQGNGRGYLKSGTAGEEFKNKENSQEAFSFRKLQDYASPDVPGYRKPQWFPEQLPELKTTTVRYFGLMEALGWKMLELFEEALGVAKGALAKYYTKTKPEDVETSYLRLVRYPQQDPSFTVEKLGARQHTDTDAITILYQDMNGGLEVRTRSGEWRVVTPIEGTFVVNVGECLKVWSDGIFTSSTHRVVNRSPNKRFSVVFFFDPLYGAVIERLMKNPDPDSIAPEDSHTAWPRDKPFVYGEAKDEIGRRIIGRTLEAERA